MKSITDLGRSMALLPVEPEFARAILASKEFSCTLEILDIVCVLSASSKMFIDTVDEREAATDARKKFRHPSGDHMTILNVVRAYDEIATQGSKKDRRDWCKKQFLNDRCLVEALDIRSQLRGVCERIGLNWRVSCSGDERPVLSSLVRGLVQNTAFLQVDGTYKQVMGPSVSFIGTCFFLRAD